jgi:fucose permease
MVISMILCGWIAGQLGKARTLGISMLLMGIGILFCAISPVYGFIFLALIIAGTGEGLIEGLATPFVQELHPKEPGRYINFTHSFWSVGVVSSVLIAGALLAWGVSWRIVVAVAGVAAILPSCILLFPDRKKRLPSSSKVNMKELWNHASYIFHIPRFWLFFAAMFFAGGGEYCLTFWVTSFIKLDYPETSMFVAGVGTVCFAAGMIVGRILPGILIKQKYLKHLIVYTGLIAALISVFFPLIHSLWGLFIMLLLVGIFTGPFWPSIQCYCIDRVEGDMTTIYI